MNENRSGSGPEEWAEDADALGALRSVLDELPRRIEPERDLLPEIAGRAWRRPARRSKSAWRIAASVVLFVGAAIVAGLWIVDPKIAAETDPPSPLVVGGDAVLADLRALEKDYADAIDELGAALASDNDRMAPETRRLIEDNLRIIDGALAGAQAALANDPANAGLRKSLVSTYEHKLGFLRQAAGATVQS